jgi:hypothetical protein
MRGLVRRIVFEVSEKAKPTLGVRIGSFVERMVVHTGRRSWDSAVICLGVEVYDAEAVFKHNDSRDERFALDAVFVQLVRVSVRGRDKYYSVGHERFDESGWDLALRTLFLLPHSEAIQV